MESPQASTSDLPLRPPPRLSRRERRELARRTFGTTLLTTFATLMFLATTVSLGVAGLFLRHANKIAMERQVTQQLESVARLAARDLGGRHALIARATHPNQAVRRRARESLEALCVELRDSAQVSEVVVFTLSDREGATAPVEILGASTREEAPLLGRLLADSRLAVADALARRGPATSSSWSDRAPSATEWTLHKSAYCPILDPVGAPVALVGVELPAGFAAAVGEVDRALLALGALAGLTVLLSAVFLVRQRVQMPVRRLVRAMEREEGPEPARIRHNDEIGVLTMHYNSMVERIAEKDQKLQELYERAQQIATFFKGYSNSLVAGVPEGVVAVDVEGTLTVWNSRAQAILRESRPLGERLVDEGPLGRALQAALSGSATEQALFVLEVPGAEGEPDEDRQRLVELTCAPFRDEEGQLLGAVALLSDRTELERFRRAASRNERLEAIGSLGGGLAHEIKNPLGAISGFAELIERKAGEDISRLAHRLRAQVQELNAFLDKFLGFARDDRLRRGPTNLGELIQRCVVQALVEQGIEVGEAEAALGGSPVTVAGAVVQVRLELSELPPLALDGMLLHSAVVNLLRNALQAMPNGGELTVRCHRLGRSVYVRVRDQGQGIPLELREKIFDPLFTTRAEGTGLGLAVCHKAVTAHGGKLSVREAPEGGAEFVIRLPMVVTSGPSTAGAPGGREEPVASEPGLGG